MNLKKVVLISGFLLVTSIASNADENTAEALVFSGSTTELRNSWQLNVINANAIWSRNTITSSLGGVARRNIDGTGVKVGVIDTGINNHFEYAPRLLGGYDFVRNNSIRANTDSDFNGHGSHVSGIIAAGVNNSTRSNNVAGVAPGASLVPIRVLDARGSGSFTAVAAGINYSTFGKTTNPGTVRSNIYTGTGNSRPFTDIINLSLGASSDGGALRNSLINSVTNGQLVAIAAGNSGGPSPESPANYAGTLNNTSNSGAIIAVGSVTCSSNLWTSCTLASYSNKAGNINTSNTPYWFLVAPGSNILSTYDGSSTATRTFSGTSMATPVVAGAAALLKQYWNINGQQIARILLLTARDIGPTGVDSTYGQGLLDLTAALNPVYYNTSNSGARIIRSKSTQLGAKEAKITTLNTATIQQSANAAPSAFKTALSNANLTIAGLDDFGRDYSYNLSSLYTTSNSKNYYLEQMFSNMDKNVSIKQLATEKSKLTFTQAEPKQNYFDDENLGIKNSTTKSNLQLMSMSLNTQLSDSQAMTYGINSNTNNFFGFANTPFENSGFIVNKIFDNPYLGFNGSQNFAGFSSKIDNEWNVATGVVTSFNPLTKYQASNDPHQTSTTNSSPTQNITSGFVELSKQMDDNKFAFSFGSTIEKAGLLGGTTDPLFGITDKSNTMFISLKNAKNIAGDTWLAGSFNQGLTLKNGQQDSLVSSSSNLISQSWSLGLIQSNILSKEDRFGIAINQPLVVKSGSLNLNVPTGLEYDTGIMQHENRKVSIAPTAIERNVEANYFVPTSLVSGISFSGVYRMNPENNDSNPSQKTVAVRWQSLF
jgi:subtilisin family serine protease